MFWKSGVPSLLWSPETLSFEAALVTQDGSAAYSHGSESFIYKNKM